MNQSRKRELPMPFSLGLFRKHDAGNVAIIFGLAALPLFMVMGMSVDYTMAGRRQAKMNAVTDAAVLSTTTPAALLLPASQAASNATTMFLAQAGNLPGVGFSPSNLNIQVRDQTTNGSVVRTTTASYSATSANAFSALLKMNTIAIAGTSVASSQTAPNIDFYLMLDTSPSMGIAATPDGINTMVTNTPQQGGCAFACHETTKHPTDTPGNPNGEDNYTLARALGVVLRIDLVQQATANLIGTAISTQAQNNAKYRVSTSTFADTPTLITPLTYDLQTAKSQASTGIQLATVYDQNGGDTDTQFDTAMSLTQLLPNPGQGTNALLDSPQEVLFLVTDGVLDETVNGQRVITTIGKQVDYCTRLKTRGVRIAVLYTTYLPLPTNAFYNAYVKPLGSDIANGASSCASPGLYFEVSSGGDINAAMQALFAKAVTSAHLTQ